MAIKNVRKRDGRIMAFRREKIAEAIFRAAHSVGGSDRQLAEKLASKAVSLLEKKFKRRTPSVEDIQDTAEKVLIKEGHAKTAKAYILYRQERTKIREEKERILEKKSIDDIEKSFDINALRVLKARYLRKTEDGRLAEWPRQMFTRIAVHAALPDLLYDPLVFDLKGKQKKHAKEPFDPLKYEGRLSIGRYKLNRWNLEALKMMFDRLASQGKVKVKWAKFLDMLRRKKFSRHEKTIEAFYSLMASRKFLPNTPAIANFGNPLGMGSACFVIDIQDSIESIMEALKTTAIIFQSGGGMGYNFSSLRPEGDYISTTGGRASGPASFMRLFDTMTEVIRQGGIRRGANMGILNINHPDIEKFIKAKQGNMALRNFNISVMILPDFWEHYKDGKPYPLINPRTGKKAKAADPKQLFDMAVYQAWESAEPGVIFLDTVNKYNPFYESLGPIWSTNPCVTADALISTERGLERIDSIVESDIYVDNRLIWEGENQKLLYFGTRLVKPLRVIKTGYRDTFKLTTKSGYEIIATSDHKIKTVDGWKRLDNLRTEDYVYIQSGEGNFNEEDSLPFKIQNEHLGDNGRKYSINLPAKWTKDLGLLLGWLVGDGFISEKHKIISLVFSNKDEEARAVIQPIFESYCKRKIRAKEYPNGCVQIRSNSKYVVDFFLKLGYNPSEREVPKSVFTAPREAVITFLEGLFSSDGTIAMGSKSRNYIRLNSSSLKLLKQVQLILLNLGIRSSIYNRSTKPKVFFYKTKNGSTKSYETSGENYELNISKKNLSRFLDLIDFIQNKNKEKTKRLRNFEFYQESFIDRVASIEYAGKKEVWDIIEPLSHSFIANGIIVHNCGEVMLYPNESCNLGSINVWAFVSDKDGKRETDFESLKAAIFSGVHFLDNVIEVNKYPVKAIEEMTFNTRKIGLGIMGLADALFELSTPYDSEEGFRFMERLMEFFSYWSKKASVQLAKERGSMPYFSRSSYSKGILPFSGFEDKKSWTFDWQQLAGEIKKEGIRNGYTTVIAPTGSISMIAGCSSGIEPLYSLAFEKHVNIGEFHYIDHAFERKMQGIGLLGDKLMSDIAQNKGSIRTLPYVSNKLKKIFVTAMDISPDSHIKALAAFQKWTDSSISKTINFPSNATVEDMKKSYILAYRLGCKDLTVFRDTSIKSQVLRPLATKVSEQAVFDGQPQQEERKCPFCSSPVRHHEGCFNCVQCGYGMCT